MKRNSISSITRFGMILGISAFVVVTWGGVSVPVRADSTSTIVWPDSVTHSTNTQESYGVVIGSQAGSGSSIAGNYANTAVGARSGVRRQDYQLKGGKRL